MTPMNKCTARFLLPGMLIAILLSACATRALSASVHVADGGSRTHRSEVCGGMAVKMTPGFVSLIVVVILWASGSGARTWHIRADGTGEAPTIQAGIDSAVTGCPISSVRVTSGMEASTVYPPLVI